MNLVTALAISKAKKLNHNEWWAEMVNLLNEKHGVVVGLKIFETSLKADGFFNENIVKMYNKLKKAELPE